MWVKDSRAKHKTPIKQTNQQTTGDKKKSFDEYAIHSNFLFVGHTICLEFSALYFSINFPNVRKVF